MLVNLDGKGITLIAPILSLQQAQYEAKIAEERERHDAAEAEIEEVENDIYYLGISATPLSIKPRFGYKENAGWVLLFKTICVNYYKLIREQ